jgi:hypothetical protein
MDGLLARWAPAIAASPLALWIGGSLLVYAIVANALWFFRNSLRPQPVRWLAQAGRFAFYLVVPYLALGGWPRQPYQGLLSLEDMGLVGLSEHWPVARWLEAAGIGLGWGGLALVLLALAWVSANRRDGCTWVVFSPSRWWTVLVGVLYLEVHWAFYRGALVVMLDDLYVAAFLGWVLVYLEWSLDPFWRQGWRLESRAAQRWLHAALALVTTVLFLLTRNLWVCLVVHVMIEFSIRWLGRERARRGLAPSSPPPAEPSTGV